MSKHEESLNVTDTRKRLFSKLDFVLGLAEEKIKRRKVRDSATMKWCRILVSCVDSYGKLLEHVQLDDLENRITKLEENKS
jgi:hypothetical protein